MRNVLIFGKGLGVREIENQIKGFSEKGLQTAGYIADLPDKSVTSIKYLGSLRNSKEIIIKNNIDDTIIFIPKHDNDHLHNIISDLQDIQVRIWVKPEIYNILNESKLEEFAGIPMYQVPSLILNAYQRLLKRIFDLVLGTFLLVISTPLLILISLVIKIDSPGRAIFKQRRMGEKEELFWMYKFRTMIEGADDLLEYVITYDDDGRITHKKPDDPRVTRVGKLLRRTSLDELPQLLNVLKGDMSLVGPRPELPFFVELYEPWQRKRFTVPQGLTGWWQINGRSDKPLHLHTEDDLYYIQNYSIILDIKILYKTIFAVLRGKGAY